jgi:hypothetical protein
VFTNRPLFLSRLNSLLNFINFAGRVDTYMIDEDEGDLLRRLLRDNKVKLIRDGREFVVGINSSLYPENRIDNHAHPLILELAAENPAVENHVKIYRKNLDYCPLTIAAG